MRAVTSSIYEGCDELDIYEGCDELIKCVRAVTILLGLIYADREGGLVFIAIDGRPQGSIMGCTNG